MSTRPKAILFGAIGTLVETSEMQRQSFNRAFRKAGLDWEWSRTRYLELLQKPGGRARIADFADDMGAEVDVDAIYAAKVAYFRTMAEEGLDLRPGVREVIHAARAAGVPLGFATSTGTDTVDLIFLGLSGTLSRRDFAFVGDRDVVTKSKPSGEIYRVALAQLGISARDAIAIEDTPESAEAALAAHVPCIGFPGVAARHRTFPRGVAHVVDRLEPFLCDLSARAA